MPLHGKWLLRLGRMMLEIYAENRVARAAASLSYFLTLAVFPMLICLYGMLGGMFPAAAEIRAFLSGLLPADTTDTLVDYLRYISENMNPGMIVMALTVVVTSSSAALRTIDNVMGEMRSWQRYGGALEVIFSMAFSLVFLAAVYLAATLIVTGKWFLELLDRQIMFMNLSDNWSWGRFLVLYALMFALISVVYRLTAPRTRTTRLLPGALAGSVALLLVSMLFSGFISASVKYPLLYGSLASAVIMMFWFYVCGIVLFMGGALNVALERLDAERR